MTRLPLKIATFCKTLFVALFMLFVAGLLTPALATTYCYLKSGGKTGGSFSESGAIAFVGRKCATGRYTHCEITWHNRGDKKERRNCGGSSSKAKVIKKKPTKKVTKKPAKKPTKKKAEVKSATDNDAAATAFFIKIIEAAEKLRKKAKKRVKTAKWEAHKEDARSDFQWINFQVDLCLTVSDDQVMFRARQSLACRHINGLAGQRGTRKCRISVTASRLIATRKLQQDQSFHGLNPTFCSPATQTPYLTALYVADLTHAYSNQRCSLNFCS